ncbi:MAG: beta-propeller domain-containing protein, partial [Acidimicrobiia bacterium]
MTQHLRTFNEVARARAVAVLVVAVLVAGCSGGGDDPPGRPLPDVQLASSLQAFDSCDEVRAWARDDLAPRVGAYGFPGPMPLPAIEEDVAVMTDDVPEDAFEDGDTSVDDMSGDDAGGAALDSLGADEALPVPGDGASAGDGAPVPGGGDAERAAESGPADGVDAGAGADGGAAAGRLNAPGTPDPAAGGPGFSRTNVQVAGIDEPDIVKTDGERILAVAGGRLHLASAEREEIIDSVDLPEDAGGARLLLSGDRVVVMYGGAGYRPASGAPSPDLPTSSTGPVLPTTRLVQVDIDGDTLRVTDRVELEGSFVSARMTGDVARVVLHADPQARLPLVAPASPTDEAQAQARQLNQRVIEDAAPEDFLPTWRQLSEGGEVIAEGRLMDCADAHAPRTFAGFGMVAVATIDVSEGVASGVSSAGGTGVMAGGETVYASSEHLYVAAPEWPEVVPGGDVRGGTGGVSGTVGDGSGRDIAVDVAPEPVDFDTDIHRFDISDPRRATYEMSGQVDGRLLDQFAMDEHDGHLRVATTTGMPWAGGPDESESHVTVLAPDGGALVPVGQVSGLGRGETIRSVRFMGDVGYVVTFQQVDPLYTIDLSDPEQPRATGELKMLGYSAYLHPIGDGKLIGVGQDATERGVETGTQIALFDVRDPAAPKRVAQATLPGARSDAEQNHHAFLWWAPEELAAIPVSTYDRESFQGLVGFDVDADEGSITERGRVRHPARPGGGIDPPVPLPEPVPEFEPGILPDDGPAVREPEIMPE